MRNVRFFTTSSRSNSYLPSSRRNAVPATLAEDGAEAAVFPREVPGSSYGLNSALAGKGVIVKDKAFRNLKASELQQKGAIITESLSRLPVHVRGKVLGGASDISKAGFSKLLKQVTTHMSSITDIFVHDGAIGSSPKCDAKVRFISDSPSAVLSISKVLWSTPTRAVSHDTCALTAYIAASLRFLVSGASGILLFASEDSIRSCLDPLVSTDAGVILFSDGVAPLFQTRMYGGPNLYKLPAAVIFAAYDSSGAIPSVSKLSPGQAAYHFLAGYQNGNFVPAYSKGPSSIDPLELAKSLLSKLKDNKISSFLVNVNAGEKRVTGKDFVMLVQSTLSDNIPPFEPKGGDLQRKYKSFLWGKFQELPEEFSF